MAQFPIVSGQFNLLDTGKLQRVSSVTVTNTSAVNPATVTVTDPNGSVVFHCQLGGNGATTVSNLNAASLVLGVYTVAVVGAVNGLVTTE